MQVIKDAQPSIDREQNQNDDLQPFLSAHPFSPPDSKRLHTNYLHLGGEELFHAFAIRDAIVVAVILAPFKPLRLLDRTTGALVKIRVARF
jgi:hypothetical protein